MEFLYKYGEHVPIAHKNECYIQTVYLDTSHLCYLDLNKDVFYFTDDNGNIEKSNCLNQSASYRLLKQLIINNSFAIGEADLNRLISGDSKSAYKNRNRYAFGKTYQRITRLRGNELISRSYYGLYIDLPDQAKVIRSFNSEEIMQILIETENYYDAQKIREYAQKYYDKYKCEIDIGYGDKFIHYQKLIKNADLIDPLVRENE